jgi:ribosomal protein L31
MKSKASVLRQEPDLRCVCCGNVMLEESACPEVEICHACHLDECPYCGPRPVIVLLRRLYHLEVPNTRYPVRLLCGAPYILIDSTSRKETVNCDVCLALMKGLPGRE